MRGALACDFDQLCRCLAARPAQQICLHAVCLAEPEADSESWDAISAVSSTRDASDTIVIRATKDLEAGAEVRCLAT